MSKDVYGFLFKFDLYCIYEVINLVYVYRFIYRFNVLCIVLGLLINFIVFFIKNWFLVNLCM